MSKNSPDRNHDIGYKSLKYRCGGYEKDKLTGHHYAWLRGFRVVAYDLHLVGRGIPDWLHFVSWMPIFFEIKAEREVKIKRDPRGRKTTLTDKQYYYNEMEDMEKTFSFVHPGLVAIVHDQNEIYEWLNLVVDFVEYIEGKTEGSEPLLKLFFRNAVKRQDTQHFIQEGNDV